MQERRSSSSTSASRAVGIHRLFGKAGAAHDLPPYRAGGPVTAEEYESRAERYDGQLKSQVGFDPAGKTTAEKMAALRAHREAQYLALQKVVYKRRSWTDDGLPTRARLEELGIVLPEVLRRMNWDFALIVATVNGRHVPPGEYETTPVPDGAEVPLIHVMHGG